MPDNLSFYSLSRTDWTLAGLGWVLFTLLVIYAVHRCVCRIVEWEIQDRREFREQETDHYREEWYRILHGIEANDQAKAQREAQLEHQSEERLAYSDFYQARRTSPNGCLLSGHQSLSGHQEASTPTIIVVTNRN